MVSTDDMEIADLAKRFGAKVPFMRSAKTSDDFATTTDVLIEVLSKYKANGAAYDHCCCLYPTAPFITPKILKDTSKLLGRHGATAVIPVAKFPSPIQRALIIENGLVIRHNPEFEKTRSQDLPPFYFDVGQFYWFNADVLLSAEKEKSRKTIPYVVSAKEFHDIDTIDDWLDAEITYEILSKKRNEANFGEIDCTKEDSV